MSFPCESTLGSMCQNPAAATVPPRRPHGPPTSPRCAGQRSRQLRQSYHWPIDNHLQRHWRTDSNSWKIWKIWQQQSHDSPDSGLAWMVGERTDAALNWHLTRWIPNAGIAPKRSHRNGVFLEKSRICSPSTQFQQEKQLPWPVGSAWHSWNEVPHKDQPIFQSSGSKIKSKNQKNHQTNLYQCFIFVWSWHDFGHFPYKNSLGKIIHTLAHGFLPRVFTSQKISSASSPPVMSRSLFWVENVKPRLGEKWRKKPRTLDPSFGQKLVIPQTLGDHLRENWSHWTSHLFNPITHMLIPLKIHENPMDIPIEIPWNSQPNSSATLSSVTQLPDAPWESDSCGARRQRPRPGPKRAVCDGCYGNSKDMAMI